MVKQAVMERKSWVNPNMADIIAEVGDITTLGNCGVCQGLGRVIVEDRKTGRKYSVTCANCEGSGQK